MRGSGARSLTPSAQTQGRTDIVTYEDEEEGRPHSSSGASKPAAQRHRELLPPIGPSQPLRAQGSRMDLIEFTRVSSAASSQAPIVRRPKPQASYGIRSKSLGLTQAGLDLTFDQAAIHEIYNDVIPWVAKRGGFKDVDSLTLYEGDTFDGANDKNVGKGQAFGSSQKRKAKDMGSKKRAAPAALEYGGIRTDVQKDLAVLVEGQWKSAKDRKHVTQKLRAAGVLDTVGLKELIFTKALDPKGLPKATFFRGEACELNRRIKDKGGSMFTTSTLESLVTALEFRDLVARKDMEAVKRSEKILTDGDMTKTQWAAQASSVKRGKKLVAAPERRPMWMDIMAATRMIGGKSYASCHSETPEAPFVTIKLKAPMASAEFCHLTISSDSSLLAAGAACGNVAIISGMEHVTTLARHKKAVRQCAFNPSNTMLATASDDGTVCVWELSFEPNITGQCVRVLKHGSIVRCCSFHPEGSYLVTAGDDLAVCLWYLQCWKESNASRHSQASGGGELVVEHWNFPGSSCVQAIKGHTGYVTCATWSIKLGLLITGGVDRVVRLHKRHPVTKQWVCIEELRFTSPIETCEVDAYDTMLVVACKGLANVSVYYLSSHTSVSVGFAPGADEVDIAFTTICNCALQRSMGWLACADADGILFAYSRRPDGSWRHITTINAGIGSMVGSLVFSPNGAALFSANQGGLIRAWDVHTLIHIPDCIALFKEVKWSFDHPAGLGASRDDVVSYCEIYSALSHVGYGSIEMSLIVEALEGGHGTGGVPFPAFIAGTPFFQSLEGGRVILEYANLFHKHGVPLSDVLRQLFLSGESPDPVEISSSAMKSDGGQAEKLDQGTVALVLQERLGLLSNTAGQSAGRGDVCWRGHSRLCTIFVCGTYDDFVEERERLVGCIVPGLHKLMGNEGVSFNVVDVRRRIEGSGDMDEEERLSFAHSCLAISNAKHSGLAIAFLGDEEGSIPRWHPPKIWPSPAHHGAGDAHSWTCSPPFETMGLASLEVYDALLVGGMEGLAWSKSMACIRDPLLSHAQFGHKVSEPTKPKAEEKVVKKGGKKGAEPPPPPTPPTDEDIARDQRKTGLKDDVRKRLAGRGLLDGYTSLAQYTNTAMYWLASGLSKASLDLSDNYSLFLSGMQSDQEMLLRRLSAGYAPTRTSLADLLDDFERKSSTSPCTLILRGPAGSGKSCGMAEYTRRRLAKANPVFYFFREPGDDGAEELLVEYLIYQVNRFAGMEHPAFMKRGESVDTLMETVQHAGQMLHPEEVLIVVLDGLRDEDASPLIKLFSNLAKQGKARLIVSVSAPPDTSHESSTTHIVPWESWDYEEEHVGGAVCSIVDYDLAGCTLTNHDRHSILVGPSPVSSRGDKGMLSMIEGTSHVPLEEIDDLKRNAEARTPLHLYLLACSAARPQSAFRTPVPHLPDNAQAGELFTILVLPGIEADFPPSDADKGREGGGIVGAVCCIIAVAGGILTLADLCSILPWEPPHRAVIAVLHAIKPYLAPSGDDELLRFKNACFETAVIHRYCSREVVATPAAPISHGSKKKEAEAQALPRVIDGVKVADFHNIIGMYLMKRCMRTMDGTCLGGDFRAYIHGPAQLLAAGKSSRDAMSPSLSTLSEAFRSLRFLRIALQVYPARAIGVKNVARKVLVWYTGLKNSGSVSANEEQFVDDQIEGLTAIVSFLRKHLEALSLEPHRLMELANVSASGEAPVAGLDSIIQLEVKRLETMITSHIESVESLHSSLISGEDGGDAEPLMRLSVLGLVEMEMAHAHSLGLTKLLSSDMSTLLKRLRSLCFSSTVMLRLAVARSDTHKAATLHAVPHHLGADAQVTQVSRSTSSVESVASATSVLKSQRPIPAPGSPAEAVILMLPQAECFDQANFYPWNDLGHSWEGLFDSPSFQKLATVHLTRVLPPRRPSAADEENEIRRIIFRSSALLDSVFTYYRSGTTTGHNAREPLPNRIVHQDMHISVEKNHLPTMPIDNLWRMVKECGLLLDNVTVPHVNRWVSEANSMSHSGKDRHEGDIHSHKCQVTFLQLVEVIFHIASEMPSPGDELPLSLKFDKILDVLRNHSMAALPGEVLVEPRMILKGDDIQAILRMEAYEGTGITHEIRLRTCFEFFGTSKLAFDDGSGRRKDVTLTGPEWLHMCQTINLFLPLSEAPVVNFGDQIGAGGDEPCSSESQAADRSRSTSPIAPSSPSGSRKATAASQKKKHTLQVEYQDGVEKLSRVVGVPITEDRIDSTKAEMCFLEFLEFVIHMAKKSYPKLATHSALNEWLRAVKPFKKFIPSTVMDRYRDNASQLWPWIGFLVKEKEEEFSFARVTSVARGRWKAASKLAANTVTRSSSPDRVSASKSRGGAQRSGSSQKDSSRRPSSEIPSRTPSSNK